MEPQIVTRDSWVCVPFTDGIAIPFHERYTIEEFERIRRGLLPLDMDDKWFMFCEGMQLFLHRSWTSHPIYRITFEQVDGVVQVVEALTATPVKRTVPPDVAYDAALVLFLIGNLLLGKRLPFPMPSDVRETMPGMFQHSIAGRGYPQIPFGEDEGDSKSDPAAGDIAAEESE